jgi:ferric-dicitrate binding protein FerR (iron transport regulator)
MTDAMTDYLFDKTGDDPAVTELEDLLGAYAHRAPLREPPVRRRRWALGVTSAALVAAAIAAIWIWRNDGGGGDDGGDGEGCRSSGPGFAFAVAGGPARCGGDVASRGTLPVGAWLETSGGAVADVRVADIGELTVYGDSRVRLVGTGAAGHHMELARGKVAARVVAPPRLFVVDTPVATAVDLGCAYELAVDDSGRTRLHVTSGVVSLEGHGLVAYAPRGTEVIAAPGRGPGTPVAVSAPDELRAAVARFDGGDPSALGAIVDRAELRDSITLWNLLSRTTAGARAAVVARLEQLSGRPRNVRTEDVLAGDAGAIERWREALDVIWGCPGCGPSKR